VEVNLGLSSKYTLAIGRLPDLFAKIRDGQAPDIFNQQLLKDWGFSSSNDRVMIPMLKELGFLSPDGKPTSRYHDYRDHSQSKAVMADALRDAYSDLFLIKEHPADSDKPAIQGKFKSFHNVSDHVAGLMMRNFYALLALADIKGSKSADKAPKLDKADQGKQSDDAESKKTSLLHRGNAPSLHYNIQIHLPATKDAEVYNAIFKSLREHLIAE
jgi:hypothetical protein